MTKYNRNWSDRREDYYRQVEDDWQDSRPLTLIEKSCAVVMAAIILVAGWVAVSIYWQFFTETFPGWVK